MPHSETHALRSRDAPLAFVPGRTAASGFRGVARDGSAMRLFAAMAETGRPHRRGHRLSEDVGTLGHLSAFEAEVVESDAQYFRRRSGEERRSAAKAAGSAARKAHEKIAEAYARLGSMVPATA